MSEKIIDTRSQEVMNVPSIVSNMREVEIQSEKGMWVRNDIVESSKNQAIIVESLKAQLNANDVNMMWYDKLVALCDREKVSPQPETDAEIKRMFTQRKEWNGPEDIWVDKLKENDINALRMAIDFIVTKARSWDKSGYFTIINSLDEKGNEDAVRAIASLISTNSRLTECKWLIA